MANITGKSLGTVQDNWIDLQPAYVTSNTTAPNNPSFTIYNGGNLAAYEFVGVSSTKQMYFGFQMPHGWIEGSTIFPHLHLYIPSDATGGAVKFYMEYSWENVGSTGSETVTTISNATNYAANTVYKNEIMSLTSGAGIVGTGKTISSVLMCRIWRDATDVGDTFASSVWLKSIDIHVEQDMIGSTTTLVK